MPKITFTCNPSLALLPRALLLHIWFLVGEERTKVKKQGGLSCACATTLVLKIFCPGCYREEQKSAMFLDTKIPLLFLRAQSLCYRIKGFKPLPKHTEAVKQTETQESRKQTQNQAGCCSVVKQYP